jgi:lysophospholipase L1-like esterase
LAVTFFPHEASAGNKPQLIGMNGQGGVLFVGDSLTVGSDAFGSLATRTRNTGIWTRVTVDARVGRTASAGASIVKTKVSNHTTAIVIALGTNDMLSKPESWYPAWVIDKVMNATKGRPVLWFTLEYSSTSRREWRSRAARFNRSLKAAVTRWPQLTIADWNTYFVPNKVSRFIADGVHLTVAGYRTRATFTLRQMEQFGEAIVNASTTTTTTSTTSTTLPDTSTTSPTTPTTPPTTSSTTTTIPAPTTT